jgi:hypothetical protein
MQKSGHAHGGGGGGGQQQSWLAAKSPSVLSGEGRKKSGPPFFHVMVVMS